MISNTYFDYIRMHPDKSCNFISLYNLQSNEIFSLNISNVLITTPLKRSEFNKF